ncbi:MAG: hypothetical protein ACTHKG_10270 [Nocardioides sp.]
MRIARLLRGLADRLDPDGGLVEVTLPDVDADQSVPPAPPLAPDTPEDLGWWAIRAVDLKELLRRVGDGEDWEWVWNEAYANSAHIPPGMEPWED